jgi:hypothetical protein
MSALDDGLIRMTTLPRGDGSAATHDEDAGSQQQPSVIQKELDQAMAALQLPEIAQVISALAALQRPGVVEALGVLHRLAAKNQSIAALPGRRRSPSTLNATFRQTLKPIFVNNLFITTFAWTFLGIFLLYVADRDAVSDSSAITIFSIYMIIQVMLIVLILYVTSRQVKKVSKSNRITLGFLIQGWLSLVYSFAGIYAFLNHAYQLGLLNSDPNVRHTPCALHVRSSPPPCRRASSTPRPWASQAHACSYPTASSRHRVTNFLRRIFSKLQNPNCETFSTTLSCSCSSAHQLAAAFVVTRPPGTSPWPP